MSGNESIQAEQDGTEPSSAKTAVPPMADLRLASKIIQEKRLDAYEWLRTARYCMWPKDIEKAERDFKAFDIAWKLIEAAKKQKACSA